MSEYTLILNLRIDVDHKPRNMVWVPKVVRQGKYFYSIVSKKGFRSTVDMF